MRRIRRQADDVVLITVRDEDERQEIKLQRKLQESRVFKKGRHARHALALRLGSRHAPRHVSGSA